MKYNTYLLMAVALDLSVVAIACAQQQQSALPTPTAPVDTRQFLTEATAQVRECVLAPAWYGQIVKLTGTLATVRDASGFDTIFSVDQLILTTQRACIDIPAQRNPT